MKSRMRRSSTLLLMAMLGLSSVLGTGCASKKKKQKTAIESPDDPASATTTPADAKTGPVDQAANSTTSTEPIGSSGLSTRSELANSGSSSSGLGNDPLGGTSTTSATGTEYASATGATPIGEGIEPRHGATTIGEEPTAATALDTTAADVVPTHHKKKHKRGKKKKHAVIEEADAAPALADDDDGGGASKGSYVVKKGDTLAKIAKKNHLSLKKLMKLNGLTLDDAPHLKVGTRLKLAGHNNAA